jgi:hypothetical protein
LGLQYIPSVLNIWANKLSRSRLSFDWALPPSSLDQLRNHLPHHHSITHHPHPTLTRRDTVVPGVRHFHSPTGTEIQDPEGRPLPPLGGQMPWPTEMGLALDTSTPAQAGLSFGNYVTPPRTPPSSYPTGRRNPGTTLP